MLKSDIHSLACQGALKAVHQVRISPATSWLQASVWVVLSKIIWLSAFHAISMQKNTRSCMPSRPYFRRVFGLSVSTISRITSELGKLSFVSKFQRRPVLGQFQTCLYKLEGIIWAKVEAVIIEFIRIINRVASVRHIVSKGVVYKTSEEEKRSQTIKIKGPPEPDYISEMTKRHPEWQEIGGK